MKNKSPKRTYLLSFDYIRSDENLPKEIMSLPFRYYFKF